MARILEKEREQKALMDYKAASGQEVTESDRQRWFAYLDVTHIARKLSALGLKKSGQNGPHEKPPCGSGCQGLL